MAEPLYGAPGQQARARPHDHRQPAVPQAGWEAEWPHLRHTLALVGLLLACAWHLPVGPTARGMLMSLAAMAQLYLPVLRADRRGWPLGVLGLGCAQGAQALGLAAALALLILPPWLVATKMLGGLWLTLEGTGPWGVAGVVGQIVYDAVRQLLGIVVPEEVFWRGYIQPLLTSRFPAPCRPVGRLPVGAVLATALFAAVHLIAAGDLLRLSTFFPGLVFAWQRQRHGTLVGAIALHTACNVVAGMVTLVPP